MSSLACDTIPAPPEFEEEPKTNPGGKTAPPPFVGQPAPLRMPEFPAENSMLHEKLEAIGRNERILDEALYTLETSVSGIERAVKRVAGAVEIVHQDIRGLRLIVEQELTDLKRRVGELEHWRRSLAWEADAT